MKTLDTKPLLVNHTNKYDLLFRKINEKPFYTQNE